MERKLGPLELPIAVLLVLIAVYTLLSMDLLSQYKSLPSPLYGGDYYYQLGAITHLYNVPLTEWTGSSNGIGSRPAYFILYSSLVAAFGMLFSMEPLQAIFSFNWFVPAASLAAFFLFYRKIFGNPWLAIFGSVLSVSMMAFPLFKYTDFTKYVITPLFLYALYSFYKVQGKREAIILGLAYGLMGLSHSTAFVFATGSMAVFFAYLLYLDRKSLSLSAAYLKSKQFFAIAFLLGFLISQLYWFQPIFVLHGNTMLGSQLWSTDDFSNPAVQWGFFWSTLQGFFLNFVSIRSALAGLLAIAGLVYVIKNKASLKENEVFILLIFALAFVLTFSYFLTMPLLGTNLVPNYLSDMYLTVAVALLSVLGLSFVVSFRPEMDTKAIVAASILVLAAYAIAYPEFRQSRFEYGPNISLTDSAPHFLSLKSYFDQNKVQDSIVLTGNEVGFAMNAITGRGLVLSRRAHNDPFVDFDRYQLDGAIMLYGNDPQKRLELMKRYNVSYLFYDSSWLFTEWQISNGQIVGYSDPILLFYSPQKEQELAANGIKYMRTHGYVDPAVRGSNVKTYDLLVVSPENYNIDQGGYVAGKGIWNPGIDANLQEVWRYDKDGFRSILYKVDYS